MMRRLPRKIGLFYKRALQKRLYSAKKTQKVTRVHDMAMMRRLPRNIGLFCKRALQKKLYSAKKSQKVTRVHHMGWLQLVGSLEI